MDDNSSIVKELKEVAPFLVEHQQKNPYKVSPDYFNFLAETVVQKISEDVEPVYYFSKANPYPVPENYFDNFSASVLSIVRSEKIENPVTAELEQIAPFLNTIAKKPTYTIPLNYLDEQVKPVLKIIKQEAPVIAISKGNHYVKYLVAAIFIGLLGFGMYLFFGKDNATDMQAQTAQSSSEVKKLSEEEIIDFLKSTSPTDNIASTTSSNISKDMDIKRSVSKMTDKEIQQFLAENGEQIEM